MLTEPRSTLDAVLSPCSRDAFFLTVIFFLNKVIVGNGGRNRKELSSERVQPRGEKATEQTGGTEGE